MNRRGFVKYSLCTIGGLAAIPFVDLPKASSVAVLRNTGKVRYKDLDWRLDSIRGGQVDQLYAEQVIKGKRHYSIFFIAPEESKQDKLLGKYMDMIAKRANRRAQRLMGKC